MLTFQLISLDLTLNTDEPTIITPIREPIKWADVRLILERDPDWHGCNYDYSDGNLRLEFSRLSACDLIREQYDKYGPDALVRFQVVDTSTNPETIDYDGKLDFGPDSIEFRNGRVSCSIVRDDLHHKLVSRWDSPVALSATTSMDGVTVFPAPKTTLHLPGQFLHEKAELNRVASETVSNDFPNALAGVAFLLPNLTSTDPLQPFTLDGLTNIMGGVVQGDPAAIADFAFLTSPGQGTIDLFINWNFEVNCSLDKKRWTDIGAPKFTNWVLAVLIEIRDPIAGNQKIQLIPIRKGSGEKHRIDTQRVAATYQGTHTVNTGTQFILYAQFLWAANMDLTAASVSMTSLQTAMTVSRLTRTEASSTVIYSFADVARQVFGVVSSSVDAGGVGNLSGSLLSGSSIDQPLPGPATEYALTSGLHLRLSDSQNPFVQRSPSATLKDIMQTLRGLHAAGIHYTNDNGLQVEPIDWFYRGEEILQIDRVFSYAEKPDTDLLFSKLEIGYEKFPDEGPGVADEFNTVRQFQLPMTAVDKTLEIKVPFIAAGTAIEKARKLSFTKTDADGKQTTDPTAAGQYDDDVFLIHTKPETYQAQLTFIIEPAQPFPGTPYEKHLIRVMLGGKNIRPGDVLYISSGLNVSRTYVVIARSTKLLYSELEVLNTEPMTPGTVQGSYVITSQPASVRTNERLEVTGIASPETTYNLELSPDRMLLAHAHLINSGLRYKSMTTELVLTLVKHNDRLLTRCKDSSGPLPYDPDRQLVYSGKNVPLGKMQRFKRLFSPEIITAKVALTRTQFRLLVDALRNRGEDAKRMGYVSIKNDRGSYTKAYVTKLIYNPSSDEVDITLRKRFILDGSGQDCSDFAGWTFEQFMAQPDADPNFWLFCKFATLQIV